MRNLLLAALVACTHAAPAAAPLELVESEPVETTLPQHGLREAWQVWPEMIGHAAAQLDFAEFYASEQAPSRLTPVIEALQAALRRGVRVRFLADARFAKTYPEVLEDLARSGAQVRRLETPFLHAKYFIVDGREAYLGSQNFDWRSLEHIQELGVRFGQPDAVRALLDIFETDWTGAPPEQEHSRYSPAAARLEHSRHAPAALRLVASPHGALPDESMWDLPALVELLDSARKSLRVQLLTWNDDVPELRDAMVRAAARGVSVQMLLSDWELRAKTLRALRDLDPRVEVRILTIPPAPAGFIPFARVAHAKYCAVDAARGWVGTGNWERDYFEKSRNVGLLFDGGQIPAQLDAFFTSNWNSPYATPFDRAREYAPPRISLGGLQ